MNKQSKVIVFGVSFAIILFFSVNIAGIFRSNLTGMEKAVELLINGLFAGIILATINQILTIKDKTRSTEYFFINDIGFGLTFFYWWSLALVLFYSVVGIGTVSYNFTYPEDFKFHFIMMLTVTSLFPKVACANCIYSNNEDLIFGITHIPIKELNSIKISKRIWDPGYDIMVCGKNGKKARAGATSKTVDKLVALLEKRGIEQIIRN